MEMLPSPNYFQFLLGCWHHLAPGRGPGTLGGGCRVHTSTFVACRAAVRRVGGWTCQILILQAASIFYCRFNVMHQNVGNLSGFIHGYSFRPKIYFKLLFLF